MDQRIASRLRVLALLGLTMAVAQTAGAQSAPEMEPIKYIVVARINQDLARELQAKVPPAAFEMVRDSAKTNYIPTTKEMVALGMDTKDAERLLQHVRHITELRVKGIVTRGGPTEDFDYAINLFVADSEEQARTLHDADPWVEDGILTIETVYRWRQAF